MREEVEIQVERQDIEKWGVFVDRFPPQPGDRIFQERLGQKERLAVVILGPTGFECPTAKAKGFRTYRVEERPLE